MKIKFVLLALLGWTILDGCDEKKDDATPAAEEADVTLSITGLEDLGSGYRYEGWVIDTDGNPTSTGVFTVNSAGALSATSFKVDKTKLDAATKFVVSIEPNPDSDPKPADTKILAGPFSSNSAALSLSDDAALKDDFSTAAGGYFFATPTDDQGQGDDANELSGVWFGNPPPSGQQALPTASLVLPTLPAGWKYEGWAVVLGTSGTNVPLSTGTFLTASGADDSNNFKGDSNNGTLPPFPGEDFLDNAPAGVTFPLNLSGAGIVVSVEPDPDNSPAPFLLKPLLALVPASAAALTQYSMTRTAATEYPTGTATRQ